MLELGTEQLENKTANSRWLITSTFYTWWMKQQVDFQNQCRKILNKLTK